MSPVDQLPQIHALLMELTQILQTDLEPAQHELCLNQATELLIYELVLICRGEQEIEQIHARIHESETRFEQELEQIRRQQEEQIHELDRQFQEQVHTEQMQYELEIDRHWNRILEMEQHYAHFLA